MIIGTCGFCSTGSSAVSDYLKEFDENQVLDKLEFTMVYLPDGLEDLDYHLNHNVNRDDNCCIAIPRFRRFMKTYEERMVIYTGIKESDAKKMTDEFLDSLIQMRWVSRRRSDKLLYTSKLYDFFGRKMLALHIIPFLNKRLNKSLKIWPNRVLEVSINPDGFVDKSKLFIKKIFETYGADFSKNIVLDQPFVGNNPAKSFRFFENPVAIVVDRDPRDNYIFTREVLIKKSRIMPVDNVEEFVKYYRLLRENQPYQHPNDQILRLNFEEMVYDYDAATTKIRKFCHLPENPRPFSIFDPKLSINNTQLILKFPQYQKDVEFIERELPEYLFDFSRYPKPDNSGRMFRGKSPLNK